MTHEFRLKVPLFSAIGSLSLFAADPAPAIDPGCYAADVVRKATWLAEGQAKQYTIISGLHAIRRNPVYLTSNDDGSEGYSLEKEDDKICVSGKYTDIKTNQKHSRPGWANIPKGSFTDRYVTNSNKTNTLKSSMDLPPLWK